MKSTTLVEDAFSNCSMLEAIEMCRADCRQALDVDAIDETNRIGDHIWWISDIRKFKAHYPGWNLTHDVHAILTEIFTANSSRWQ